MSLNSVYGDAARALPLVESTPLFQQGCTVLGVKRPKDAVGELLKLQRLEKAINPNGTLGAGGTGNPLKSGLHEVVALVAGLIRGEGLAVVIFRYRKENLGRVLPHPSVTSDLLEGGRGTEGILVPISH